MSEGEPFRTHSQDAGDNDLLEPDAIGEILMALQRLAAKTDHPVVRACLEQAHDDIVHLTSHGEEARAGDGAEPAAA